MYHDFNFPSGKEKHRIGFITPIKMKVGLASYQQMTMKLCLIFCYRVCQYIQMFQKITSVFVSHSIAERTQELGVIAEGAVFNSRFVSLFVFTILINGVWGRMSYCKPSFLIFFSFIKLILTSSVLYFLIPAFLNEWNDSN